MAEYIYNIPYTIQVICSVIGIFVAITVHSFSKAAVSTALGDVLPKRDGRLTLNPIKHFEPVGFFLLLFLNFGWDKPIRTSSNNYKDKRIGTMLVNIMPIVISILVGISFSGIGRFTLLSAGENITPLIAICYRLIIYIARACIAIGLFNLIPIYPLDGLPILQLLLKPNQLITWVNNEKILQMILIMLLYFNFIDMLFSPIISLLLFYI